MNAALTMGPARYRPCRKDKGMTDECASSRPVMSWYWAQPSAYLIRNASTAVSCSRLSALFSTWLRSSGRLGGLRAQNGGKGVEGRDGHAGCRRARKGLEACCAAARRAFGTYIMQDTAQAVWDGRWGGYEGGPPGRYMIGRRSLDGHAVPRLSAARLTTR